MRKKVKEIASHPLISGTFIIFSGGIIANFFNFLFNLTMSRNLPVEQYGTLISLISITLLAAIPASSALPTIVSIAGSFFSQNNDASLKAFYFKMFKPLTLVGLMLFVLFVVFLSEIEAFLNIHNDALIVLTAVSIFIGYIGLVNLGFLQARLSFKVISISNIFSSATKLGLGFALVLFGYGVAGGMLAYFTSLIIPLVIGFVVLRKIFTTHFEKMPTISFSEMFSYGIPSAIAIFSLSSFISNDIILVKHFFTPHDAGLYAGLSLVGKVIYYLTAPIGTVMFPIIIQKFNKKENFRNTFFLALFLVGAASLAVTFFYFIFPTFTILLFLKNPVYKSVVPYLGLFGVFISIYSLVSILIYFFLSVKKTSVAYISLGGACLQLILISLFHYNFISVIFDSIIALSLLLIVLLLYYLINYQFKNAK